MPCLALDDVRSKIEHVLVFFVWNVVAQSEGAGCLSLQPPPEGCARKGGLLKRVGAISPPAGRQHRP